MKFRIYRTSGETIDHPHCKKDEYAAHNRYDPVKYVVELDSLEDLIRFANDIWYSLGSHLEPYLIIKQNNEIEIYDTYRE
jgi:hypothetical protein